MLDASVRHCDYQRNNPKSALIYRLYVFRQSLAMLHTAATGRDKTVQQLKGEPWEAVLNVITGFNQLQLECARESPGNAVMLQSHLQQCCGSQVHVPDAPEKGRKNPGRKAVFESAGERRRRDRAKSSDPWRSIKMSSSVQCRHLWNTWRGPSTW